MVEGEFRPVRPDARPTAQTAAIAGIQRPARLKGAALAGFDAPRHGQLLHVARKDASRLPAVAFPIVYPSATADGRPVTTMRVHDFCAWLAVTLPTRSSASDARTEPRTCCLRPCRGRVAYALTSEAPAARLSKRHFLRIHGIRRPRRRMAMRIGSDPTAGASPAP